MPWASWPQRPAPSADDGLNVHAARTLHGADHAQVERFVRYLARPPIAQDRLERLEDGRVRYRFKRPWFMTWPLTTC